MVGGVYSEWLLLSILSASAGFSSVMPIFRTQWICWDRYSLLSVRNVRRSTGFHIRFLPCVIHLTDFFGNPEFCSRTTIGRIIEQRTIDASLIGTLDMAELHISCLERWLRADYQDVSGRADSDRGRSGSKVGCAESASGQAFCPSEEVLSYCGPAGCTLTDETCRMSPEKVPRSVSLS